MEYNYIYDLNDKINLIYDYLYNVNTKNCFNVDKISLGNINIDDIKLRNDYVNEEDIEYYNDIKKNILNGQFKFLYFNKELLFFIFKKYTNHFNINIKICFYNKNDNIQNINYDCNNDSLISYLLSYLVLSKYTKHILLPIVNIDCNISDINFIIKETEYFKNIKKLLLENKITNTVCLQIRESYFKNINLEIYFKNNLCEMKILFFQVFHTLASINEYYNGFSHNNLILENITAYLKNNLSSYTEYDGFKNDKFYINNIGFDIKITNFEKAYIPNYYGDKKNIKNDIFTLFDNILNNFNDYCDDDTLNFINFVYPPNIRKNDNSKVKLSIKDLLYHKYFLSLLEKPEINFFEETYSNNQYLTGKLNNNNIKNSTTIIDTYVTSMIKKRIIRPYANISDIIILKRKNNNIRIKKNQSKSYNKKINTIKYSDDSETNNSQTNDLQTQNQSGGFQSYSKQRPEKNNPFLSNDQKKAIETKSKEFPPKEPPVLLEQKLYDTTQTKQPKEQLPSMIPLYDPEGNIANRLVPYSQVVNQVPIQKIYNISLANPIGNYTTLNRIFEDLNPSDQINFTALTIYERKQIIDFLRNNLIDKYDGEEMNIKGGNNSLLSYIKIMNINPYSLHKQNKFIGLAKHFILYNAAYPVRFDEVKKQIGIGKFSMGLNIRIYMLTIGDMNYLSINNNINEDSFDLWREIKYYNWVKQEILRKKVSPNFIAPILYKIDSESRMNWPEIESIKKKITQNDVHFNLLLNQKKINNLHSEKGFFYKMLPLDYRKQLIQHSLIKSKKNNDNVDKLDLTRDSGKLLILLTEAPTNNIISWATPLYENFGTVKKMTATGYHAPHVWVSILFQLVYAFAVLYKKIIYINNFKLEHNVYIKDVTTDLNNTGSWIYKIDNIEYYIPNYGYIVMIDTKYSDIEIETSLMPMPIDELDKNKKYKINGSIYNDNNFKIDEIKDFIFEQFKNTINVNNFSSYLKIKGGHIPDDTILELIKNIWEDTEKDIKEYILKYFKIFLHNRVGTPLYKSETENVSFYGYQTSDLRKGKLMVRDIGSGYQWVMYIGDTTDPIPKKKIITKDKDNNYIFDDVFTLYNYPDNEKILPDTKKNLKYDDNHIFETYVFDNI